VILPPLVFPDSSFETGSLIPSGIFSGDRLGSVVCKKCAKRRSERKEIIMEIVETEIKYGRDLRIIVEEFYRPMLVPDP
jgi:hypothetical protein